MIDNVEWYHAMSEDYVIAHATRILPPPFRQKNENLFGIQKRVDGYTQHRLITDGKWDHYQTLVEEMVTRHMDAEWEPYLYGCYGQAY